VLSHPTGCIMSPVATNTKRSTYLLYRDLRGQAPEVVVKAEGSYLWLDDDRRYVPRNTLVLTRRSILDACAGAAVASIGHGDTRIIQAVAAQMTSLSYHHTSRLTNPAAEALAKKLVGNKPGGLSHAIFLSSGSEANESAIKLARQDHVERGELDRVHIISRNNSYHGNSIGCVSLTGIPVSTAAPSKGSFRESDRIHQSRRRAFEPILMPHTSRVSPCYPYRYKLEDETDQQYAQRLADELENEILRVGSKTVAAFFAETGKSRSREFR
jgi:adenosylmethionine-8-amino-7-oxononanoate aminotransferase